MDVAFAYEQLARIIVPTGYTGYHDLFKCLNATAKE